MKMKKRLLDGARLSRTIRRLAIEIVERNKGTENLVITGIRSRGVPIAERIVKYIKEAEGVDVPLGKVLQVRG